jgi:hypothetical protein
MKKPNKSRKRPRYWMMALPIDLVADIDAIAGRIREKRSTTARMLIRAAITARGGK